MNETEEIKVGNGVIRCDGEELRVIITTSEGEKELISITGMYNVSTGNQNSKCSTFTHPCGLISVSVKPEGREKERWFIEKEKLDFNRMSFLAGYMYDTIDEINEKSLDKETGRECVIDLFISMYRVLNGYSMKDEHEEIFIQ